MEFVDETVIKIVSGSGGDGTVAFRRERNVPLGGPTGGDGGNGGSVILYAERNADTLLPLARTRNYVAKNGERGRGNYRHGAAAPDLRVPVPVGTTVYDRERLVADLSTPGQEYLAASGGAGGKGNATFAEADNRSPQEFTYGGQGRERMLRLELKLIADVGLLGLPNAGKSTLLSRLSAARPKIADYPFTTLQPQLGVVSDGHGHELVMADIPGLIEGAADGAGMGMKFLRHIERCAFLLHLVDLQPTDGSDPAENYRVINAELERFSPRLAAKPQLAVGNKLDLTDAEGALEDLRETLGVPFKGISAVTGKGLTELVREMFARRDEWRRTEAVAFDLDEELPVEPARDPDVVFDPSEVAEEDIFDVSAGGEEEDDKPQVFALETDPAADDAPEERGKDEKPKRDFRPSRPDRRNRYGKKRRRRGI